MATERKIVRISKRKLGLVFVGILAGLAIWYGVVSYNRNIAYRYKGGIQVQNSGTMEGDSRAITNVGRSYDAPELRISKPESVPITNMGKQIGIDDTREFLKTSYSSIIKTRDVQSVVTSVKNIVKGNDGRVDNISSSELNGYLTFVVPKTKFEAFRTEVEALTHQKLYSETSTSQNLLGQKQSIEDQTSNINKNLASLNEQKEALKVSHAKAVAVINKELQSIRTELANVRKQIAETTDTDALNSLRSQESSYVSRETAQKQKLSTENSQYTAQNSSLETQITYQNTNLENVNKQDENFTENIETVDGRVDVRWVSIWQLIKIFSPIPAEILVVLLVIIFWNILAKLNVVPKFVLE
jgi:hypothetical protein